MLTISIHTTFLNTVHLKWVGNIKYQSKGTVFQVIHAFFPQSSLFLLDLSIKELEKIQRVPALR